MVIAKCETEVIHQEGLIGVVTEIVVLEAQYGDVDLIHLRQTSDQLVSVKHLEINNNYRTWLFILS